MSHNTCEKIPIVQSFFLTFSVQVLLLGLQSMLLPYFSVIMVAFSWCYEVSSFWYM